MESRLSSRDVAFDLPADADEDSAWQAPQQYLEDVSTDPASVIETRDHMASEEGQLARAMASLDARSKDIVARRWLSEPKTTLHELADEYGVSAERIRQLENNAMKKLRMEMVA
jgi:RNA polymerase sigma-32 factor